MSNMTSIRKAARKATIAATVTVGLATPVLARDAIGETIFNGIAIVFFILLIAACSGGGGGRR